jgi:hypothetical protein
MATKEELKEKLKACNRLLFSAFQAKTKGEIPIKITELWDSFDQETRNSIWEEMTLDERMGLIAIFDKRRGLISIFKERSCCSVNQYKKEQKIKEEIWSELDIFGRLVSLSLFPELAKKEREPCVRVAVYDAYGYPKSALNDICGQINDRARRFFEIKNYLEKQLK